MTYGMFLTGYILALWCLMTHCVVRRIAIKVKNDLDRELKKWA